MSLAEPYDDRKDRERQSAIDRATIKVKLIENAILVSGGEGWFSFNKWEGKGGASEHIAVRIETLNRERAAMPRSSC